MWRQVKWVTAHRRCKQLGANLASVLDSWENRFLTGLISTASKVTLRRLVWFGLNRRNEKGWRWTDGSPVVFTNWSRGRPDNRMYGKCGALYSAHKIDGRPRHRGKRGKWEDNKCFRKLPYVCKRPK
ncbi:alpha-N-acetylgalactosamine-specific lectin-like [Branchiostoma floridae x Branchiostoma belcheri]